MDKNILKNEEYLLLIRWWKKNPMEKMIIRILMIKALKLIDNVYWKKGEEIPDIFWKIYEY